MNLDEAFVELARFRRRHPETKKMSPEEITEFAARLPLEERKRVFAAQLVFRDEVHAAIKILMEGKL